MQTIGQRIREKRKELGKKVYELAQEAKVSPVYITHIEKYNRLPSLDVINRIGKVLNLDLNSQYTIEKMESLGLTIKKRNARIHQSTFKNSPEAESLSEYLYEEIVNSRDKQYDFWAKAMLTKYSPQKINNKKFLSELADGIKKVRDSIKASDKTIDEFLNKFVPKILE